MTTQWASQCPFCRAKHDAATSVTKEGDKQMVAPADGDITLCIICGEWSLFDSKAPGGMRPPTDREYEKIATAPMCRSARAAWLALKDRLQRRRTGRE